MLFDACVRLWSTLAQAAGGAPVSLPQAEPSSSPSTGGGLTPLQYVVMALYLLVCLGLIAAVLSQSSKEEGLSGMLGGGSTQSVFRGKKSFEEKLQTATNVLAVSFIVLSMLISWLFRSS